MSDAARRQWLAAHEGGFGFERAALLLDRYGTVAADVIEAIAVDEDDRPLRTLPDYSTGELRHLARAEHVVHLDDLLLRRTSIAFVGAATADSAEEVADAVAPVLGWSERKRHAEAERALQRVHAADPEWPAAASVSTSR